MVEQHFNSKICILGWLLVLGISMQIASCNGMISQEEYSYMLKIGQGVPDLEGDCIKQDVLCMNCSFAIRCIEVPGGWMKVPQEQCSEGQTCNAKDGGCSKSVVPECDSRAINFKFTCEQVGSFPDPFDCRRFHMCAPHGNASTDEVMAQYSLYCPRHYSYDPITTQCRLKLPWGQCQERPVPLCTKVGQSGTLASHNITSLYYVCLKKELEVYPQVFICPFGHFYWPTTESCHEEPPPAPTQPPTTTTTTLPPTTLPPTTTTAAPPPTTTPAPPPTTTPAPPPPTTTAAPPPPAGYFLF